MGEAVPGNEGFDAALEAVVDSTPAALPEEPEAAPEPTPAPVVEPEPAVPLDDGEVNRTAKFSAAMKEFEELLPEDKRQAFKGRVEQGVRWGRPGEAEIDALTERFSEFNKLAEELAPHFEGGPAYLKQHGAAVFLRDASKKLLAMPGAEPEQADTGIADVDPALAAIQKQLKELQAERAQERRAKEDKAAEDQLKGDLAPLIKETIAEYGITDEGGKMEKSFAHLAQLQYFYNAYGMPAGTSTPARAVKDVADMLEVVVGARAKKAPTRTKPSRAETARNTEPRKSRSFKDANEIFLADLEKQAKAVAAEIT